MRASFVIIAATLAACATPGSGPEVAPAPAAPTALPDGVHRLDRSAVATHYRLSLTVDPREPRFSGTVDITVQLAEATQRVRMHGEALTFQSAIARLADGREIPLTTRGGKGGALEVTTATPLPAGPLTLSFAWTGAIGDAMSGLYRVHEGDHWYAFTQFEPLDARRVYPCFDQPDMKARYATSLTVPSAMLAVSNAPETKRSPAGPDHTRFDFATTPPLPSYLVAFAVGALEVVEAPAGDHVPLRVITTAGRSGQAGFALEKTPQLLRWLEDWFGSPYPFAKLDLVAVPNFSAGAMENAGLVTFRESLLLIDGANAPPNRQMYSLSVNAHELAHMWFGNLVTLAWWDDLWLNEAFATWMGRKAVTALAPELEIELSALDGTNWAMGLDAKANARSVRQPVHTAGDIMNAFDGITYTKGSAVLDMLQHWLGEDTMQRGVRRYMNGRIHGNATTGDLMMALETTSGRPVRDVVARFLDQPGTPLVDLSVECPASSAQKTTLVVSQTRYRPLGGTAPAGEPWSVPICVRYGHGAYTGRDCVLLTGPSGRFELSERGCPDWLVPNDGERGYYRWNLEPRLLDALAGRHQNRLSLRERVALPGHLRALVEAGKLNVAQYVQALNGLAINKSAHRSVIEGVIDGLRFLERVGVSEAREPAFARLVTTLLDRHLDALDLGADATVHERRLRPLVVRALGELAGRDDIARHARAVADATLDAIEAATGSAATSNDGGPLVNADQTALYLPLAARLPLTDAADATWKTSYWQRLRDAVPHARDALERAAIIRSLGSFPEPTLFTQSLQLVVDKVLRTQDFGSIARRRPSSPATVEASWAWLTTHFDSLLSTLGPHSGPRLPMMAAAFCTAQDAERVAAFFETKRDTISTGLSRNLGLALESIDQCVRLRAQHAAALDAVLAGSGR